MKQVLLFIIVGCFWYVLGGTLMITSDWFELFGLLGGVLFFFGINKVTDFLARPKDNRSRWTRYRSIK